MRVPQTLASTLTMPEALDATQPDIGAEIVPREEEPFFAGSFACNPRRITDGDTIRCGTRPVRLYGIDVPEMPEHCRPGREFVPGDPYASADNFRRMVGNSSLQCRETDIDLYGRTVARCSADGQDLSCAQIMDGQAIKRYGTLSC
jgi:endonuclease YncB( thermonuclease family)